MYFQITVLNVLFMHSFGVELRCALHTMYKHFKIKPYFYKWQCNPVLSICKNGKHQRSNAIVFAGIYHTTLDASRRRVCLWIAIKHQCCSIAVYSLRDEDTLENLILFFLCVNKEPNRFGWRTGSFEFSPKSMRWRSSMWSVANL